LDILEKAVEAKPYLAKYDNPQIGSLALMEKEGEKNYGVNLASKILN